MNILADTLAKQFEEIFPMDFYREIFPSGELDEWRENPSERTEVGYTGIIVEVTKEKRKADKKTVVKRHTVTDDLDAIDSVIWGHNFCVMSPISYVGKSRVSRNARIMYALVVELDNLRVQKGEQVGLRDLILQWSGKSNWLPCPTYVVASGTGVHLYYVFEKGLPLFPNVVKELSAYKRELTTKIWNKYTTTSHKKEDVQQESIFQAFRMVGTITKKGDRVRAFRTGERVSVEYMNSFVKEKYHFSAVYRSELTLAQAKEKYPDWYERRIVRKEGKGRWTCHRGLYDWWRDRILYEAKVGHRYYCLMMLSVYAIKCEISFEELEMDCYELMYSFEGLTESDTNHFTEKDVVDALQSYEDEGLVTYPITSIANRSGLAIEKNKRNGRKRSEHVKLMNFVRDEINQNNNWREGNGRPDKEAVVKEWRLLHPDGKKADCIRDTGLTKPTVYKWWD